MNDTIRCPTCKTEINDVDNFLGHCDKCLGIDDEGWSKRQNDDDVVFNESEYGKARKELWARVFSVTSDKQQAYRLMDKIVKKLNAWSFNDMTLDQLHQAYKLTNSIRQ